jgi:hypothetical protein
MKQWKVGDLVAVNKLPDGQVYEIYEEHTSNKFMKYLVYMSYGRFYGGGWTDVCVFREPTKEQLTNYIRTNRPQIDTTLFE